MWSLKGFRGSFTEMAKSLPNGCRNSNVWLPSLSRLRPIRTCFSPTCPRLDENDGTPPQHGCMRDYYMASSVSWRDESNRAPWLATRACKKELSCSLGTTHRVPQENYPESHIINPLLPRLVRSTWLDIGLFLFLRVYGPHLRLHP